MPFSSIPSSIRTSAARALGDASSSGRSSWPVRPARNGFMSTSSPSCGPSTRPCGFRPTDAGLLALRPDGRSKNHSHPRRAVRRRRLDRHRPARLDPGDRGPCADVDGVLLWRWQGDRKRERQPAVASVIADNRVRAAQQPLGCGKIAGRDQAPDVGAADRPAVDAERRHDGHLEGLLHAGRQIEKRLRRAPALVAECRVRRHHEAGQLCPAGDAPDEVLVGGHSEALVEMLDDDDLDPGLRQQPLPLRGIEEQGWRFAPQHRVGVGIERHDGRFSRATWAPAGRVPRAGGHGQGGGRRRHRPTPPGDQATDRARRSSERRAGSQTSSGEAGSGSTSVGGSSSAAAAASMSRAGWPWASGRSTNTLSGARRPFRITATAMSRPAGSARR